MNGVAVYAKPIFDSTQYGHGATASAATNAVGTSTRVAIRIFFMNASENGVNGRVNRRAYR
jgi:hypothetical protein